ncbi:hypothetical protein [Methylobacterium sp. 77]|uniref:hypothetical protein n=1 Tax=Methylobacterium sp. 77 TaxID=1101192 RepID=UPI00036E5DC5|nr:hypothetical protein [Methylobacterium sp. 77]
MDRFGRVGRVFGTIRRAGSDGSGAREMPLRHKLMLILAFEIMALGFRQADLGRHDKGIVVEAPAHAGNAIV